MLAARADVELQPPLPLDGAAPLDEDAIAQAADLLAKAECPAIFVGGGALDAADEVRALAESRITRSDKSGWTRPGDRHSASRADRPQGRGRPRTSRCDRARDGGSSRPRGGDRR